MERQTGLEKIRLMAVKTSTALVAKVVVSACAEGVAGPGTPLRLAVDAVPRTAAVGGAIRILASACNPTDETIDQSSGCGPSSTPL